MTRRLHPAAVWLLALAATTLAACTGPNTQPSPTATPSQVVLMTHDSFAVSPGVLEAFQAEAGANVSVLKAGDAGSLVNQAILTRDNPVADVLFGVDNTFLSRALEAGVFQAYESRELTQVPEALRLDAENRVTPIDYGDVCLNFDREAFADEVSPPATLEDLTRPEYRSMLIVQNAATSSPGLSFMLATIARFGESDDYTWLDYWRDLRANDVLVASSWEEAYFSRFSGGAGEGDRPIVVSYATSPVAEVQGIDPPPAEAPTGVVDDGCFRQIEFAAVLTNARFPEMAQRLVDYMLTADFQADIPLNMYVFPSRTGTTVPGVFADYATEVSQPLTLDPQQISTNRERWLEEWTDVVVR